MKSQPQDITAQFVMVRSPMTFVLAGQPSRTAAGANSRPSTLRAAIDAIAGAVNAFPISALHARKQ